MNSLKDPAKAKHSGTTIELEDLNDHRLYRVGVAMWLAWLNFLFGVGFTAVLLGAFLFGDDGTTTLGDRLAGTAFVPVFMGLYLLFSWGMVRQGVFVDEAGVVVRRFLRTRRSGGPTSKRSVPSPASRPSPSVSSIYG